MCWLKMYRVVLIFALAAALTGCASTAEKSKPFVPPVYPPPPEQPRFIFEMSLRHSAQVTADPKEARLRYLLTGELERGESLQKPFDVAACQGKVFVSDSVRRRVFLFDVAGRGFSSIGEVEPGTLRKPLGLATDGSCNLYVADQTLERVMVYDQAGGFLRAFGGPKVFHRLSHVVVNAEGTKLFAVDTGGVGTDEHRIRVFDIASGKHLNDIGKRGKGPGELNLPRDIALAPDGNLYVVDGGNFRVMVFRPDGTFVRNFGKAGAGMGQFSRPKGIAIDKSGNVYVSDTAFGNFQVFTADGQLLLFVGNRSNVDAPGNYTLPAGIDVDEDGRIYFVDQFFRRIDVFRPAALAENAGFLGARLTRDGK